MDPRDPAPFESDLHLRSVVFIDPGVAGWQTLAAGAGPGVEVVPLDPARDALEQMADTMAGRQGVEAIHVISHGAPGALHLGGTTLTTANLGEHRGALATIGNALSVEGDLLLYGCNLAAGEGGRGFLQALAEATGADVAASDDATGAVALGGDWELEHATGQIDVPSHVLNSSVDYDGLLAAPTLHENGIIFIAVNNYTTGAGGIGATWDNSFVAVAMEDISANSTIFFTDIGFRANGTMLSGSGNDLEGQTFSSYSDGALKWVTPGSTIAAGTIIRFYAGSLTTSVGGTLTSESTLTGAWSLTNIGDSITAYQTSDNA